MPLGGQSFGDVRMGALPWWALGELVEVSGDDETWDGTNSSPQAKQVTTFVVTDPGDNLDVTATIGAVGATGGTDVTVNTGTGLDAAAIAALLLAAINAHPNARRHIGTATLSTATITLTARWPGIGFTVAATTPASIGSITAVTANATADTIGFGRAVIRQGAADLSPLVGLPKSTNFTAQVITATVVNGVATTRGVRVYEIRDGLRARILVDTVFAGSATEATEATNIAAAVELAAPANTVVAAVAASVTVTFTAEVPGTEIEVEIEQVNAGDITFAATTGPNQATSLSRAFFGVARRSVAVPATTVGGSEQEWPANSTFGCLRRGRIAVASAETVVPGGDVYVETAVGADTGKFFAATSATRIALSRRQAAWYLDANANTGSLAALRVNL